MTVIGVDPSLNSTGICVDEDGNRTYYLLATKPTKKAIKAANDIDRLCLVQIRKDECVQGEKSQRKSVFQQINTTTNIAHMADAVIDIIKCHAPDYVIIEAPAFHANGRVIDLAGLNHAIRLGCYRADIPIYPISPTTVKAHTAGSGWASKDMMVMTWEALEPDGNEWASNGIKVDDLADAWALTSFDLSTIDIEPGE